MPPDPDFSNPLSWIRYKYVIYKPKKVSNIRIWFFIFSWYTKLWICRPIKVDIWIRIQLPIRVKSKIQVPVKVKD